jgi:hypothetical protein
LEPLRVRSRESEIVTSVGECSKHLAAASRHTRSIIVTNSEESKIQHSAVKSLARSMPCINLLLELQYEALTISSPSYVLLYRQTS